MLFASTLKINFRYSFQRNHQIFRSRIMYSSLRCKQKLEQQTLVREMNAPGSSGPQIVISERGTEMLLMDGYRYGLHRKNGAKKWWRCVRHSRNCKSVVAMIEGSVVNVKEHNH